MQLLLPLILFCLILSPSMARAYDVLVLLSSREPALRETLNGFNAVSSATRQMIVLSDYDQVDVVRMVREERPKLILTMGDAALAAAAAIRETPVVAVMAYDLQRLKSSHANLDGIEMTAPPERYISMFQKMKTARVGVIHNPATSDWYLQQARQMVDSAGIALSPRGLSAPGMTDELLSSISGGLYALWILPDGVDIGTETVKTAVRFAHNLHIPVVSFSADHLPLGAIAVIEIDRTALGRQAAAMTAALLKNPAGRSVTPVYPTVISFLSNPAALRYLGPSFQGVLPTE